MAEVEQFRSWAILELMGHRQLAGMVQEVTIAGVGMLRIDVPEGEDTPAYTQFYGPTSVYCMTPVTEDVARAFAKQRMAAIVPFSLRLPEPVRKAVRDDDDDEIPW